MRTVRLSALFAAAVSLLVIASGAAAQEGVSPIDLRDWPEEIRLGFVPGIELNAAQAVSARESLEFLYQSPNFQVVAAASMNNDGKYGPDIANTPDGTFFGNYFFMDAGGTAVRFQELTVRLGRLPHYDEVDSPYSVFINSLGHASNIAEIRFEKGSFVYESRWIELNSGSANMTPAYTNDGLPTGTMVTWPDRGANIKTYALNLGRIKFGMQDFAVYPDRSFDFEYLMNPLPQYLIQYVKGTNSRPWSTGVNENYAVGFFLIWYPDETWTLNGQFFLDDGNTHWIAPKVTPNIPFKLAWTFGARKETPLGRFGLHTAGAFKYTYQSTLADYPYSYTYYPDTRYWYDRDKDYIQDSDEYEEISVEDMYIGYRNGENNLAFLGEYKGRVRGFSLDCELEYVVSGSKAPTNPWHEASESSIPYTGTEWLAESALEHRIKADVKASRRFGNLLAYVNLRLGYVFNKLTLQNTGLLGTKAVDTDSWIYKPTEGLNEPIFKLTIGGRYRLDIKR